MYHMAQPQRPGCHRRIQGGLLSDKWSFPSDILFAECGNLHLEVPEWLVVVTHKYDLVEQMTNRGAGQLRIAGRSVHGKSS